MTNEQKIDEIYKSIIEIKIDFAKTLYQQDQHRKEIDTLTTDQKKLTANQNWFFGVCSIIGLGLSAFFAWLFKHN